MFPFNAPRRMTSTLERIKSEFLTNRILPLRPGARRSRRIVSSETLETRALLAVTPVAAISAPSDAFIGSDVNLSV